MDSPEIIATTPASEFITSFSDVSSSVSALSEENNEVTVSTQEFTSETSAETLAAETLISEVISESETVSTVIETLPAETTVIGTTSASVSNDKFSAGFFDNTNIITAFALAIAGTAAIALLHKSNRKRHSPEYEPQNAKERDKARINERNAIKKAKAKKEKEQSDGKKKLKISRTVAETIPYKKILDNDIWLLSDHIYSKVYTIDDINYNMGDEVQQNDMLENYCTFLNTLDDTVDCQISVWNSTINIKDYESKILVKMPSENKYSLL